MKNFSFGIAFCMLLCHSSFAQTDTVYHYYNIFGKEVSKDSARSYLKLYQKDNLWFGQRYRAEGNKLTSEGSYTDKDAKTPVGTFDVYNDKGQKDYIEEYTEGKLTSKTFFYKNGDKRTYITYNDKGIDRQMGWDENGKEIRNYIAEKEAHFKGGLEGWKKYLEKKLNANVAADAGAPEGDYTVELTFVVSKEGYVSNVKATSVPEKCKPCRAEAINVLANSPAWEPAIQHNVPVIYQAVQYITFRVEEVKKGRKG